MQVRVLFFGVLKELAGKSSERIEVRDGASVVDVLEHYVAQIPRMRESLASLAVAVNQQYAGADTVLKLDDEVALLPPVSGGSGGEAGGTPAGQPARRRRYGARGASIVRERIDTAGVLNRIKSGEDGAAVVFEGVVRNQTRGRKTLYLDYEAYEGMALRQMEGMAELAVQKFQVREVA